MQGATQASFGAGISVGAAPPGGFGPVTVSNATTATAVLNIASAATVGTNTVTVQTGVEQASLSSGFRVDPGTPAITSLIPASGQQGQTLTDVIITGAFTRFTEAVPVVTFSNTRVTASAVKVIDDMDLRATVTIAGTAAPGASNVTVVTGSESATGTGLFTVGTVGNMPVITSLNPASGQQGQMLTGVIITGAFTQFTQGQPLVTFSNTGVTASAVKVTDNTHLTATVNIDGNAATGVSNITVATGSEVATGTGLFTVIGRPVITSVNPESGLQGQKLTGVVITGASTRFTQASPTVTFSNSGLTASSIVVTDNTHLTLTLTIAPNAPTGASNVTVLTGSETATGMSLFAVVSAGGPTITDFNPKSVPEGTVVIITGTNLQPSAGTAAQVTLAKQGGGTITGSVSSTAATSLIFVVPAGAATGPLSVMVNGGGATALIPLTVVPSSSFSVSAAPNSADLIRGQTGAYAISLTSNNGFNQLAALGVAGLPSGVTAVFKPAQITGGQTSILTLTAPAAQPTGTVTLTVSASATVDGIAVTKSAIAMLNIKPVTTSFLGRTVATDSLETSLAGVTITMLGKDGNGNTTGCSGGTVSDGAGNFLLTNLPALCIGPQLVGFDGTTVTNQSGKYAGVNLIFTFASGQVTVSPVLVHLPRFDNQETFLVQQNAPTDQKYAYRSIPGLSVIVYKGTTFTMPDGTKPNPFPLTAVQVPVDRLPDVKPPVPTMVMAFIVAFQPANAFTNQPVAVYYPNPLNTAPGTNMALLTLDPTRGQMVPYGTGTVSADGTQIVPDPDPAHPGDLYGLINFDWHMPGYPPTNQVNPCGFCPVPEAGHPVDLSSGLAVVHETDISYGGARGKITIERNYRNGINPAATTIGPFGYGSNHNFAYELGTASPSTASVINLIMPDGNQFPFSKQADGSFINSGIPSMAGAVMRVLGSTIVNLRWKDGTTFQFIQVVSTPMLREVLDSITDLNGNKIQILRSGFLITDIVDPTGRGLHFNLNGAGQITQITAPDGTFVSYDYGNSGSPGSPLRMVTRPDGNTTRYDYDSRNNLTAETDGKGVVIASNTYDRYDRVIEQRQANGGLLKFSYTLQNPLAPITSPILATTVTDALNHDTVYRFSPNGALIGVTDPLGRTRTIVRDGRNNIVAVQGAASCSVCGDSGGGDQSFSYDANGNLRSQTDALGNSTNFDYEPVFNRIKSIKDAAGNITTLDYDGNGNVKAQKDPNGNITSYQYDQFGELVGTADSQNQTTTFSYDTFGSLISIKDPVGKVTSLQYDINGRLITTQDALARKTTLAYDRANRITGQTNAQNATTRFSYDQVGNLMSVTDARNNTTSFTYDLMNRLVSRRDALGRMDLRKYDLNENLIQFQDRRGEISNFTYDDVNRLSSEAYQDGNSVMRSYDANNRLTNVNDTGAGAFAFAYDMAGRLTTSTTPYGAITYLRDALGRPISRQVVGQPAVGYLYDRAGNLTKAAMPQASANFAYDTRNLLASIDRLNSVSSTFTYDPLARLLSLTHAKGPSIVARESYDYDAVGNRSSHSTSGGQPLATAAVPSGGYDAADEQKQFGPTINTFDANGNLTTAANSSGTTTYIWDSRNRLKSVRASAGQATSFIYDFAGNLIQQAGTGTSLNLTQKFVLDNLTNVAYVNRSDGDQYSVLAGQSVDQHLAVVHASGQVEYGLTDASNSTMATLDQSGAVKGRFFYEPFGQTTSAGGAYPFQYTGRVPVSNTLYYFRARFYNATTGRFISEDPIGFGSYNYANNSPQNLIDPLGLWGVTLFSGGTGTFIFPLFAGLTGSGGVFLHFGSDNLSVGTFRSGGPQIGKSAFAPMNIGGGLDVGLFLGDLSSFAGRSINVSAFNASAAFNRGGVGVSYCFYGRSLPGSMNFGITETELFSVELHPLRSLYETFQQILGPLGDYRNFQSPLQ